VTAEDLGLQTDALRFLRLESSSSIPAPRSEVIEVAMRGANQSVAHLRCCCCHGYFVAGHFDTCSSNRLSLPSPSYHPQSLFACFRKFPTTDLSVTSVSAGAPSFLLLVIPPIFRMFRLKCAFFFRQRNTLLLLCLHHLKSPQMYYKVDVCSLPDAILALKEFSC
jgi:hypothetical protein